MRKIITLGFAEIAFICLIVFLLLLGIFNQSLRDISKIGILSVFCYWGIIALFGLLTPSVAHEFNFIFLFAPEKQEWGYPVLIKFKSKGGFICLNPIIVSAEILDVRRTNTKVYETKKYFKEKFESFNIAWITSQNPSKKDEFFLSGGHQAGAVSLDIKKCTGTSTIVFTTPGEHTFTIMYKQKGEKDERIFGITKDTPQTFLHISPPEVLVQIRNGNITYGLSLIVLSSAVFNLLNIIWK